MLTGINDKFILSNALLFICYKIRIMNIETVKTKLLLIFVISIFSYSWSEAQNIEVCNNRDSVYHVKRSNDFNITGNGSNENWEKADWLELPQRALHESVNFKTSVKSLYSENGIYFLFRCPDNKLTSSMDKDFLDLWKEDVVEIFLWPDEKNPVYFEYELSPLNYELVLIISNIEGELLRWQPFHYDSDRLSQHETSIIGGKRESFAEVDGWTAEFFIPYKLLRPLNNILPKTGDRWRANFYRVDYDESKSISWSWQKTRTNFHDYKCFGSLIFD